MPRTYITMDGMNLFHRSINMGVASSTIEERIGLAFTLIINSLRKEFRKFDADHVVFCMDGRSWRKSVYPEYKLNRKVAYSQKTVEEQEESKQLTSAFDEFVTFLHERTNVTVLHSPTAEADDMIATFVRTHPDDTHIVISSDSDYFQLLRYKNVTLYDPVKDITIKHDGIFDDRGRRREFELNTKAKISVKDVNEDFLPEDKWYEYALFLKIIRGDTSDNIFSAYPGVREHGTSKRIGIRDAYDDKNSKGYSWNTFMLTKWVDHNNVEFRVKDKYEFNRMLIDFDYAPDNVKRSCEEKLTECLVRPVVPAVNIGVYFMKFCGKWGLKRISDGAQQYAQMFKNAYKDSR